ncbi:ParA family protein [Synechococcus sp. C9]|jgi:chromosome partitioning protein|uniref:ParA family protein n=1 Tax=Synechococcus sp. C9 TaxID=102119 RepID=UPI001FF29DDF|nr:ParA family protein [Synechococcus sp. C9]
MSVPALLSIWQSLSDNESEADFETKFLVQVFNPKFLKLPHFKYNKNPNIGYSTTPIKPDFLIYNNDQPILVVEVKKRDSSLHKLSDTNFISQCYQNQLYKEAVGAPLYKGSASNNGIIQYLSIDKVQPEKLATYGLVINPDFYQFWQRHDGLIFPLGEIQRFKATHKSINTFITDLKSKLESPKKGLFFLIWNQKGGVAKTTNNINIGAELAKRGKNVLLIDLDAQGDLTRGLGLNHQDINWLEDIFNEISLQKPLHEISQTLRDSIQKKIFRISGSTQTYSISLLSHEPNKLKNFINQGHTNFSNPREFMFRVFGILREYYDYILVDLPPQVNIIIEWLLTICDATLTPVDYGEQSLVHAKGVNRAIAQLQSKRFGLPLNLGILFTKAVTGSGHTRIKNHINHITTAYNLCPCKNEIFNHDSIAIASIKNFPVVSDPKCSGAKYYIDLVDEILFTPRPIIYPPL